MLSLGSIPPRGEALLGGPCRAAGSSSIRRMPRFPELGAFEEMHALVSPLNKVNRAQIQSNVPSLSPNPTKQLAIH